ncbi:MAG TPA: hypothetical protein PLC52_03510 [Anaerolineales bacterium]|nr:hypothetical protein [Anaerolineales bacterium]HRQ91915.1 hypothetical protein [Anaerolineales bacterium]
MKPLVLTLIALILAGCGSPAAEPQSLRLAISPAAYPVAEAVMACLPTDGSVAVTIDSVYPSEIDYSDYDLYIRLGADRNAPFAARLAEERILLAASGSLSVNTLTSLQAAELLSGRIRNWAEVGGPSADVWLFLPPNSDETVQAFSSNVVRGAFSGQALIAFGPDVVLQNLAGNTGAAGLLPAAWADDSVRTYDFNVSLPVLALAAQTPEDAARSVLACLQGPSGQALLAESYP